MSTSQTLTLTVTGSQVVPPGARRTFEFAQRGGSIGRSQDCDWVLAAAGISRTHALVRYLNGLYFIEDRSTNGMLLNGAQMTRGEPATLSDGDRLQLDAFQVEVALRADASADAPPTDSAFDDLLPPGLLTPAPPQAHADAAAAGEPPPWPAPAREPAPAADPFADDSLLASLGEPGEQELDPLRLLDDAPAPPADVGRGEGWNHTPSAADHFQPPRSAPPVLLPERWDLTTGDWPPPAPDASPAPAAPAAPPSEAPPGRATFSPPGIPDFDELLDFDSAPADGAEAAPSPGAEPPPQPSSPPQPQPQPPSPPVPPRADAAAAPAAGRDEDLDRILGIVVDGVMEVLRARAEIKNTFRLPVTIIQRAENNPLKFAATPDEAIRRIMAPDSGAFLSGAAAFEDAFDDIRGHQVAMLAGMRAAFEALLFHFNPMRHEQEVDSSGKRAFAGKGRYWERYRENFEALVKDPDDCFRRLFGDEFARAYEAQLGRLKSSRRAQPR